MNLMKTLIKMVKEFRFSVYIKLARMGMLKVNSPAWGLTDSSNNSIAGLMAHWGELPYYFYLKNPDIFIQPGFLNKTPAHWDVDNNNLPLDFPHWDIMDDDGYTIAHMAAMNGTLPAGFAKRYPAIWKLKTTSRSHEEFYKRNPALYDKPNYTSVEDIYIEYFVEHHPDFLILTGLVFEIIKKYKLPIDFIQWGATDKYGSTVAHRAASYDTLPKEFVEDQSELFIGPDLYGHTVAHCYVRHNTLPIDFPHWGLKDDIGNTVAHIAARYGNLPDGFAQMYPDLWSTVNKYGNTVEIMYATYVKMEMMNDD